MFSWETARHACTCFLSISKGSGSHPWDDLYPEAISCIETILLSWDLERETVLLNPPSWLTYISSKLLLKLKAKRVHLFSFVIFFIHSWRKSTGSFNIIPGNLFSTLPQAIMFSYFSPLKRIYVLFTPVSKNKFFTCLQGVNFTKTPWGSSSSYLHLSPKDNVTYLSEVVFFFFFLWWYC